MDYFDSILATGGILSVLIIILSLFLYLLPAIIIANAIKKAAYMKEIPQFISLKHAYGSYYELDHNIRLHRKYYKKSEDLYDTPFGVFVPVHQGDYVVGFMYSKK